MEAINSSIGGNVVALHEFSKEVLSGGDLAKTLSTLE
jgi:hypothetical protein